MVTVDMMFPDKSDVFGNLIHQWVVISTISFVVSYEEVYLWYLSYLLSDVVIYCNLEGHIDKPN